MSNLLKISRQLSRVKRFQVYNLFNEYNVAEHSYRVAMLCYVIGQSQSKRVRDEAVTKALFHDLEEALMGDFPGPLKTRNRDFHAAYDRLSKDVMKENLGDDEIAMTFWQEAKKDVSGEIVYLADNFEAFQTTVEEVESGNMSMLVVLERFIERAPKIYKKDLLDKYPAAKMLHDDLLERAIKARK